MEAIGAFLRMHAKPNSRLTSDTRTLAAGDIFFAWPGKRTDGRALIVQAVDKGASAVVWEVCGGSWDEACQVPNLPVENLADMAGQIAAEYYGRPCRQLQVVAVTGTKGKTSVALWCAQLLRSAGVKTGYIGTLGTSTDSVRYDPTNLTTPAAIELQGLIAGFVAAGCQAVALEVSSHALVQGRLDGADCGIAVFTNLGQDHMDYHADRDSYLASKCLLFQRPELSGAVVNADADGAEQVIASCAVKATLCGTDANSGVCWAYRGQGSNGALGWLQYQGQSVESELPVPGRFNVGNAALAASAALLAGVPWSEIAAGIGQLQALPGRMQLVGNGTPRTYVDFAHTPEALASALGALREAYPGCALTCVFGCGGNRDRAKRSLMGQVALRCADRVIITTDNPRDEDPADIAREIAGQAKGASIILDRRAAIAAAVGQAKGDDVILLAGKGHETTMIGPGGSSEAFSDAQVLRELLAS